MINHRFFFLVFCAVLAFAGGAVSNLWLSSVRSASAKSADEPSVIRAQRFELVDDHGKVFASLGLNEAGQTRGGYLAFSDEKGNQRLELSLVHFVDGKHRIVEGHEGRLAEVSPEITIRNENNKVMWRAVNTWK
jgi:hypothetical protein